MVRDNTMFRIIIYKVSFLLIYYKIKVLKGLNIEGEFSKV
jgi:hypothetical protein